MTFAKAGSLQSALNGKSQIETLILSSFSDLTGKVRLIANVRLNAIKRKSPKPNYRPFGFSLLRLPPNSCKTSKRNFCPIRPEGIYFLGESLRTAIIALNQLPVIPDTLWLRILGKGKTQQQAIDELLTFAPDHPQRQRTLELLLTWGITIENTAYLTQSEQEIMIKLRALYQENIQSAEQKGIQTGIQEGIKQGIKQGIETGVQSERRATLETIFSARFGGVDPELMAVIDQVIILSSNDYSQLLPQLFSISREDLLKQLEDLGV